MVHDYLSTTTFFASTHHATPKPSATTQPPSTSSSLTYESTRPGSLLTRPKSLSVLSPLKSILRSSASLLHAYRHDPLAEERQRKERKITEQKQVWHFRLKQARSYDDYKIAAEHLDALYDHEAWKAEPESDEYDHALIARKLSELDDARISCDISRMLYLVRTALTRDLGGMGNVRLYKHTYTGTKDLIERYIDSTLETVRSLVSLSEKGMPKNVDPKDILEQVLYARQAFGRSALLLSGGATFGMNHIGVLKALHEAKLLPRIISGASAGSIVCSVMCTRTDEEIPSMLAEFPFGDLAVFEDAQREDSVLDHIGRLFTEGAWIDIKHLSRVMQSLLGDMTFQEAYNRTRRILNICVSSASIYELPRLLNYITSPNVMIWSAVAASCSVPLLFSAAPLLVKNPLTGEHEPWNPSPQKWVDGSVDNDLPMVKLAEMFNVNHFLVSQVNPHVVPFLEKDDELMTSAANSSAATGSSTADWAFTLTTLAKDEAIHRLQMLSDLGIFPNLVTKARSVLSQKYSGDITILPQISYRDFPRMLKNPTPEFMLDACLRGERATWPKIARIRNHCAIELELDQAIQKLRAKVVFSPSQVDLRRMGTRSLDARVQQRRVSGSNVLLMSALSANNDGASESEEGGYFGEASVAEDGRPILRSASSHWTARDRHRALPANPHDVSPSPPSTSISGIKSVPDLARMGDLVAPITPPLAPRGLSNKHSSMLQFTPTRRTVARPNMPPGTLHLNLEAPQNTSETETSAREDLHESDYADIDSHTDDSSADISTVEIPDNNTFTHEAESTNETINSAMLPAYDAVSLRSRPGSRSKSYLSLGTPGAFEPSQAAIFSQPPTPGSGLFGASLALNATTPPSTLGLSMSPMIERSSYGFGGGGGSPEVSRGRGRGGLGLSKSMVLGDDDFGKARSSRTQPSSPERRYKQLFHHTQHR